MKAAITLIATFLIANVAFGAPTEGRHGVELTLTSNEFIEMGRWAGGKGHAIDSLPHYRAYNEKLMARYKNAIREICERCEVHDLSPDHNGFSRFGFKLASGTEATVHADDWVLEVNLSPNTIRGLERDSAEIDRLIYGVGKSIGLTPHSRIGGGHLHLEISTYFDSDASLFRNFLVDLMNRPELFLGGLNLDLLNAPPLAVLQDDQITEFGKVIGEFDRQPTTIHELMRAVRERVYTRSFISSQSETMGQHFNLNQHKYHAINLSHPKTIEIRGLRPQKNATDLKETVEMFSRRIAQLRNLREPIAFQPRSLRGRAKWSVYRNLESYYVSLPDGAVTRALDDYRRTLGAIGPDSCESLLSNENVVWMQR